MVCGCVSDRRITINHSINRPAAEEDADQKQKGEDGEDGEDGKQGADEKKDGRKRDRDDDDSESEDEETAARLKALRDGTAMKMPKVVPAAKVYSTV